MSARTADKIKAALARAPGCLEAALTLKHALNPPPPGGQPGKDFLAGLRAVEHLHPAAPSDERRVLLFACREAWLRVSMMTAAGLLARNCSVDFAYLPHRLVYGEDSQLDLREFRFYYGRYLSGNLHPRLKFFDLTRVAPAPVTEAMREEAASQATLDTKWVLTREEIELETNPHHGSVYEFRYGRDLDAMRRFTTLLKAGNYDVVLIPHGNLRELGAAFRAARLLGKPTITFDFKDRAEAIVLSDTGPVSEMDTSREWEEDAPHALSPQAKAQVEAMLASRRGTEWEGFTWAAQRSPYLGGTAKRETKSERVALLCPNVAWDSALLGRDRPFPSLAEWIRQTVRHFSERDGCRLIVRVHPAEMIFGTSQPVAEIIRQSCPNLPGHIQVIGPGDPVNTYDLMETCDFGLVYNSTAGLEMAMHGLPVIVAGRPHYAEKGFTIDASTPEEYYAAIDRAASGSLGLSEREMDLAWGYANVFFFRWHKPFPWCLRRFSEHIAKWPMEKVLSAEAWNLFAPTFDRLAGRPDPAQPQPASSRSTGP